MHLQSPIYVEFVKKHGDQTTLGYEWKINGIKINLGYSISPTKYSSGDVAELIKQVRYLIYNKLPLVEIVKKIQFINTIRILNYLFTPLLPEYIKNFSGRFTEEREGLSIRHLCIRIFGKFSSVLSSGYLGETAPIRDLIRNCAENEYKKQCEVFIQENYKEINLENPVWKIYTMECNNLVYSKYDFRKIKCITLRKELMLFFKHKLELDFGRRLYRSFQSVCYILQFIENYNPNIKYLSDISLVDIRAYIIHCESNAKFSVSTIKKSIEICRSVTNYICELEEHPLSYPVPPINHFESISFRNMCAIEKRIKPIPEVVIEQIKLHIHELNPIYQLWFEIFDNTGLRASEIDRLEVGCVKYFKEYDSWVIRYIVSKTIKQRRRQSLYDHNFVVVTPKIALQIIEIEKKFNLIRTNDGIKYLFIWNENISTKKNLIMRAGGFIRALNNLAKKYNVVDTAGEMWYFSAHQFRKTVAVRMIDNDASLQEIARQFGHMDTRCAQRFYAEVSKMRLADLNHNFFEKRFNILIPKDSLHNYSENERRLLYVDFCMYNRDVELGVCLKHISQGPCSKRTGKSICAACPNMCTGPKYLPKLIKLFEYQKRIICQLEDHYKKINITGFEEFKEYQREKYLLKLYENIIVKIEK